MLRLARRVVLMPLVASLCVAAAVLWRRSYGDVDMLIGVGPTTTFNAAASYQGKFVFFFSNVPSDPGTQWSLQPLRAPAEEVKPQYDALFEKGATLRASLVGFQLGHGTIDVFKTPPTFSALTVPHWFVVLVTAVPTLLWARGAVRRWRWGRAGRCRSCGYDLRSTPDRCPECGEARSGRRVAPSAVAAAVAAAAVVFLAPTAQGDDFIHVVVPELDLSDATLGKALDRIGSLSGQNFVVRWPALEAAGVGRDTRVRLHLWNVPLPQALGITLNLVGGGTVQLGWEEIDGIITVSTGEDLGRETVTHVYDVRDLLVAMDHPGIPGIEDDDGQRVWQELIDELTRLVTEIIEPDTWRDAGGSLGSIREVGGRLIVTQSSQNHKKLQAFFAELREEFAKPLPVIQPVPATAPADGRLLAGNARFYDVRDLLAASAVIDSEWNSEPRSQFELEAQLVGAVVDNVQPGSWEGGANHDGPGSAGHGINVVGGRLVVRQSPEVHDMLKRFLSELRKELLPGVKVPATSRSAPTRPARRRAEGLFGSSRG